MTAPQIFRALLSAWHDDAASERVDMLVCELVSAAASGPPRCVSLVKKETLPRLFGLVFVLDSYGIILRQRYREQGDGVYVFVERKQNISEFEGVVTRSWLPAELRKSA